MADQKNRVISKVKRIYPVVGGCHIRLVEPQFKAKSDYFFLSSDHPNYNSIYSLIVIAAVNRYDLVVYTSKDIVETEKSDIDRVFVDW